MKTGPHINKQIDKSIQLGSPIQTLKRSPSSLVDIHVLLQLNDNIITQVYNRVLVVVTTSFLYQLLHYENRKTVE